MNTNILLNNSKRAAVITVAIVVILLGTKFVEAQFISPTCIPPDCNPVVIQNIPLTDTAQIANFNITGDGAVGNELHVGTETPVLNSASDNLIYANVSGSSTAGNLLLLQSGGVDVLRIDLNGKLVAAGPASHPAGTAGAPSYTYTGDENTGFFLEAGDAIGITTGGTRRVTVNNTGMFLYTKLVLENGGGTALLPGLTFRGDTNTGIFQTAVDTIAFTTAGTEAFRVNADNSVVFLGAVNFSGGFTGDGGSITNIDGSNIVNGDLISSLNATNLTTGTVAVARLPATVAYTNIPNNFTSGQRFSGNVGIGIAASTMPLYVSSTAATGGNNGVQFCNGVCSHIFWGATKDWYIRPGNTISGRIIIADSGGQVGIGTASPTASYKLDVIGNTRIAGNLDVTGTITGGSIVTSAFTTMNTPSGTNPVSDTSTDTLNWVAGAGVTISGNASTDTITITNTGDTNAADDITGLTGGAGISISGSAPNLTITNTGDTDASDDITGSGSLNKLAKFTGSKVIGNSLLTDNGASVAVGSRTGIGLLPYPIRLDVITATGQIGMRIVPTSARDALVIRDTTNSKDVFNVSNIGAVEIDRSLHVTTNVGIRIPVGTASLNVYDNDFNSTQSQFTGGLVDAGILLTTRYGSNTYTPGFFWNTDNNNPTKPKAGIYLRQTSSGTFMLLGTSDNYGAGITNNVVIDYRGRLGLGVDLPAARLDMAPATGQEGIRVVTSNFSPLILRNAADTVDLFRVDQLGAVTVPTGPLSVGGTNVCLSDGTNCPSVDLSTLGVIPTHNTAIGDLAMDAHTSGEYNTAFGKESLKTLTTQSHNTGLGWYTLRSSTGQYNTAVGSGALRNNTTASNNTGLGWEALNTNQGGQGNTAVGARALRANSSGSSNTSVGTLSADAVSSGSLNTALGASALSAVQTGSENVAIGASALSPTNGASRGNVGVGYNTMGRLLTGSYNTAIGTSAGFGNGASATSLYNGNTMVGMSSGYNLKTGDRNVFLGQYAGQDLVNGSENIFIGYFAVGSGTSVSNELNIGNAITGNLSTGDITIANNLTVTGTCTGCADFSTVGIVPTSSTAIGENALLNISSGTYSVAFGNDALMNMTTGTGNSGIGSSSLRLTTGNYNTGVGMWTLKANTTGSNNTALGALALERATTASGNTAVGASALRFITTATGNTAVGSDALRNTTSGGGNIAVGEDALINNIIGNDNISLGKQSSWANTGSMNVGIGSTAMHRKTDGNWNVVIGNAAGYGVNAQSGYTINYSGNVVVGSGAGYRLETGGNNVLLGLNAGDNITTGSSNIIIGSGVDGSASTGSNYLNIGDLIYGSMSSNVVGINTTNPAYTLDVTGRARFTSGIGTGGLNPSTTYGIQAQGSTMGGYFKDTGGTYTYLAYSTWGLYTPYTGYFGGNLGVGDSTPSYKLDVNGTARFTSGIGSGGQTPSTTYGIKAQGSTMGGFFKDTSSSTYWTYLSWGNYGIYTPGNAAKSGGGSWWTFSDERLKKDIHSFDDGLNIIRALNPVNFTWNGLGDSTEGVKGISFIAQDILETVPYMIETIDIKLHPDDEEETELYMLNPSAMPFVNLNAIKELDLKIINLEAQVTNIEDVEDSVESLEMKMEALEERIRELESQTN